MSNPFPVRCKIITQTGEACIREVLIKRLGDRDLFRKLKIADLEFHLLVECNLKDVDVVVRPGFHCPTIVALLYLIPWDGNCRTLKMRLACRVYFEPAQLFFLFGVVQYLVVEIKDDVGVGWYLNHLGICPKPCKPMSLQTVA